MMYKMSCSLDCFDEEYDFSMFMIDGYLNVQSSVFNLLIIYPVH